MDWAKAKTIFIIVFLLLNIFLLSTNIFTNSDLRFQSDYTRYAKAYLDSRDIQIDSRIKDRTGKVGSLIYAAKRFNFDQLTEFIFGKKISLSEESDTIVYKEEEEKLMLVGEELYIQKKLDDADRLFNDSKAFSRKVYKMLKDMGYSKANLYLKSQDQSADEQWMNFLLKYQNGLLFDQEITVRLNKNGFLTMLLPTREVKQTSSVKEEVLSAYQVLVMGELPEGAHVKCVDFGFRQTGEGEYYYSPVWRILFTNGDIYYYDAYTGVKL